MIPSIPSRPGIPGIPGSPGSPFKLEIPKKNYFYSVKYSYKILKRILFDKHIKTDFIIVLFMENQ